MINSKKSVRGNAKFPVINSSGTKGEVRPRKEFSKPLGCPNTEYTHIKSKKEHYK